ncbi:hypothetical protein HYDPIDRAFT_108746 [Hydnomerulius pinastri MD-312]|nr:hypothetical protein HYDPIDRAFT_108746 [Hydnomerulius pinastri MD-312]
MPSFRDAAAHAYLWVKGQREAPPPVPEPPPQVKEPLPEEPLGPPDPFPQPVNTWRAYHNAMRSVAFLPDNKRVVGGSSNGIVRIWSMKDGRGVGNAIKHGCQLWTVAVSENGKFIATGGEDGRIAVWDTESHEKVMERRHSRWVCSLSFSSDSRRLASGSLVDKTVVVWDTRSGERVAGPFGGHDGWIYVVAFSPCGDRIASSSKEMIRVCHSHSGDLAFPPITASGAYSLVWSPDGKQLIVGGYRFIQILDSSTGSILAVCQGHTTSIRSLAVSRDGRYIVSGSEDKTVRLWDAASQQQIGPSLELDQWVVSVAISPDNKHIAGAGGGGKTNTWSIKSLENWSTTDQPPPPYSPYSRKYANGSNRSNSTEDRDVKNVGEDSGKYARRCTSESSLLRPRDIPAFGSPDNSTRNKDYPEVLGIHSSRPPVSTHEFEDVVYVSLERVHPIADILPGDSAIASHQSYATDSASEISRADSDPEEYQSCRSLLPEH